MIINDIIGRCITGVEIDDNNRALVVRFESGISFICTATGDNRGGHWLSYLVLGPTHMLTK